MTADNSPLRPSETVDAPTPTPITQATFKGKPIRAAVVDLDGTMVDTVDDFTAALNGMLTAQGLRSIVRDEVINYIGKGSERLIRDVLTARLPAAEVDEHYPRSYDDYQIEYARINGHHSNLYPDVAVGLAALRKLGVALACVTNKPERFARELLAHYDLAHYFSVVYGGDSLPRKKPDPLPMVTACATLGVDPENAIAIGDSENDVAAARAAGLASLTVPYGYNHGQPVQQLETDAIVATLLEAARLLGAVDVQSDRPV